MNILIIIDTLRQGGAEKQAIMDANYLKKEGHTVILAFAHHGPLISYVDVTIELIYLKTKNKLLALIRLLINLRRKKIDIVHSHMYWGARMAFIMTFFFHVKWIANEHGLYLWKNRYHLVLTRIIYSRVECIVNPCHAAMFQRVEREKTKRIKNCVIYNAYDPKMVARSVYFKEFTIGFIGRLHPVKRIELLIDVAKRLRNDRIEFKCILVGDGDLEYVNDFKIRIVSENLLDHFELVGFKEDPAEWYKKFSVFILPSKVEAFSLSLLEAGASGVPCIAFDVGGNAEIIEHGKTGYLIPDQDLDTMNRIIEELYYDREKLIDMSKMAEKKILENFSMKQRYNKLLSVYGYEK